SFSRDWSSDVCSSDLAACGGGGESGGEGNGGESGSGGSDNVLNVTETQDIPSMDSALATDAVSFNTLNNTMEGLYRLGENDEARSEERRVGKREDSSR